MTTIKELQTESYLRLNVKDLDLKPQPDNMPVLLYGLSDTIEAGKIREYFSRFFAKDTPVCFYQKDKTVTTTLEKMEAVAAEISGGLADCQVLIKPQTGFDKSRYTFGDLVRILERLTGEDGCPWDKEQTHESIRSNMIEEAYEAALAISLKDKDNLIEELGDVMLQSVFHADIAKRAGEFDLSEVISALCRKLFTRHTHVFGDKTADSGSEALKNWEDAKAAEKGQQVQQIKSYEGLPALIRAQKIYKKIKDSDGSLATMSATELLCVKESGISIVGGEKDNDWGRLLYVAAAKCLEQGVDAETELSAYLDKIIKSRQKG